MKNKYCKYCTFFHAYHVIKTPGYGECRKRAPVYYYDTVQEDERSDCWPVVSGVSGCGEFAGMEEPNE